MNSTIAAKIASIFDRAKHEALALLSEQETERAEISPIEAARESDDEGITADEAAAQIGVSKWRVYEMVKRGILPAYRPSPKTLRIRRGAVREFISTGRCTIVEQESGEKILRLRHESRIHARLSNPTKEAQALWSQQTQQRRNERGGDGAQAK